MLIVLAVLVAVAGLTAPAMHRLLRGSLLASAAAEVRAELATARLAAIESGLPRQFRFQPATGLFEIASREILIGDQRRAAGESDRFAHGQTRAARAGTDNESLPEIIREDLGEGIFFWVEELGEPPGHSSASEAATSGQQWSAPIVFYPNGATLNAHFQLHDSDGNFVRVTVRGLTGTATVGPVLHRVREEGP